ncbi:hypothetical protein [Maribacter sp. 1_2014MBL_MicDiv]|uniref:hypothetical protein n=1 Tax=Maribacter sp. 1_2014MBL_MicDiv TaxID=1644130 RepID=UPI0008F460B7|nr:hypothetical protein [Maribacter sp. 1_2014MBL_MicDiv]APA64268.1 hypothetical protein YQ22_08000 [Maribacter sp. 1_2014MBL_MicDiv]
MANKNYLIEFYKWFIPITYNIRLKTNERFFSNEKLLVEIFFKGFILAHLIAFYDMINSHHDSLFWSIFYIVVYLILIVITIANYYLTKNGFKINTPDHIIIKPSVFKRRIKRIKRIKNFGFTFSMADLKKIYLKLLDAEFIDNKTSFEDFNIVLMNDFGHKAKIYWSSSLTLGQFSTILDVFEQYSKSFKPSIAFRKKLFVDDKGDIFNISSYNNAKKSRNKKVEEYFFHEEYVSFVEFMTHFIVKND